MSTIVKSNPAAPDDFFEAEAAGLRWLAASGGVRTPRLVSVQRGRIELERIVESGPTQLLATRFGRELARTHAAGASAFGAPPEGFAGQLFIGRRPMASASETSWGRFFARDRVLPFVEIAVRVGGVDSVDEHEVRRACDLVAEGAFDDDQPPARIHGDLWTGNVLWSTGGAVVIDPAAHGGHRETDLAMLALFGCPLLDEVLAGYYAERPLRPGWRDRVPLHQLHPLAVHAAGHGPAYGRALGEAAQRVIALAE